MKSLTPYPTPGISSDFAPSVAAGVVTGVASAVSAVGKALGGLFGSRNKEPKEVEMANHCNGLATMYLTEKRSAKYIAYEKSFLHGVGGPVYGEKVQAIAAPYFALIGKPVSSAPLGYINDYAPRIQPNADRIASQITNSNRAQEIQTFNEALKNFMATMSPMTPEMLGLSYIDVPAQNTTESATKSATSTVTETISKNKNTIIIVVVGLVVFSVIGYFIVKAVRE